MAFPTPGRIDQIPAVTTAHLVKLIDLAIAEILIKGQHFTADGRELTRANLDELRATRADLSATPDEPGENGELGGVLRPRFPNDA